MIEVSPSSEVPREGNLVGSSLLKLLASQKVGRRPEDKTAESTGLRESIEGGHSFGEVVLYCMLGCCLGGQRLASDM